MLLLLFDVVVFLLMCVVVCDGVVVGVAIAFVVAVDEDDVDIAFAFCCQ